MEYHDVEGILRHYDPEIRWHDQAMETTHVGTAEVAAHLEALFGSFPDLSFTVDRRIASGDLVAEEWTLRGTHTGSFLGIPATGRPVYVAGMSLVEMRDGRFLDDAFHYDAAGLLRQLGLAPSLASLQGPLGRDPSGRPAACVRST